MSLTNLPDDVLISLHQAKNSRELSTAMFRLISLVVPNHLQVLAVRPHGTEIQAYCSTPQLLPVYEAYLGASEEGDWLNYGLSYGNQPPPEVENPAALSRKQFKQTSFYKEFMRPVGAEYAFSLVSWRENSWIACLTVLKTESQQDFTEGELKALRQCCSHFQSAVERIASIDNEHLCKITLERFMWGLPSAAIVLDWDLKPLYFNASALELAESWHTGLRFSKTKKVKGIVVPADILAAIEKHRQPLVESLKVGNGHSHRVMTLFEMSHPVLEELDAHISYCPGESSYVNDGTFLVAMQSHNQAPDQRQTYDSFAQLSPRERDVVLLAAKGLKSGEISGQLGTANITVRTQLHNAYKKLGVTNRYELVLMFSQNPHFTRSTVKKPATNGTNGKTVTT